MNTSILLPPFSGFSFSNTLLSYVSRTYPIQADTVSKALSQSQLFWDLTLWHPKIEI